MATLDRANRCGTLQRQAGQVAALKSCCQQAFTVRAFTPDARVGGVVRRSDFGDPAVMRKAELTPLVSGVFARRRIE